MNLYLRKCSKDGMVTITLDNVHYWDTFSDLLKRACTIHGKECLCMNRIIFAGRQLDITKPLYSESGLQKESTLHLVHDDRGEIFIKTLKDKAIYGTELDYYCIFVVHPRGPCIVPVYANYTVADLPFNEKIDFNKFYHINKALDPKKSLWEQFVREGSVLLYELKEHNIQSNFLKGLSKTIPEAVISKKHNMCRPILNSNLNLPPLKIYPLGDCTLPETDIFWLLLETKPYTQQVDTKHSHVKNISQETQNGSGPNDYPKNQQTQDATALYQNVIFAFGQRAELFQEYWTPWRKRKAGRQFRIRPKQLTFLQSHQTRQLSWKVQNSCMA
eukprot:TRINITY_DN1563_c0_g1_i3.p1 TRINITY_DN1563_c0_g1~~TRINITY_DN1563_c0_g1_i3.p1  ORF type:complete len:330 (+),score=-3.78 TRINITY_DN1563_c0_g1_i3:129-1118(+)